MSNVVTNIRLVAVLAVLALAACTREDFTNPAGPDYEGELVETSLSLSVAGVKIIGTPMNTQSTRSALAQQTRTASNPEVLEKQVNDIWVFQFDAQGSKQLIAPRYYDQLSTDSEGKTPFNIMLRPYENCLLYIVANTNNATWAQNMAAYSVADLNKQTFTYQSETQLYEGGLPMVAQRTGTTIMAGTENKLDIELKSLVAKLCFGYKLADDIKGQIQVTKVQLSNIPDRVQLGHAFTQPTGTYPAAGEFTSISGKYAVAPALEEGDTYTWYVPQNLQGCTENTEQENKNNQAPSNALHIIAFVDSQMDGGNYEYTLYPGENPVNDFNLKNGICYNVVMTLNSEKTDNRVLASPANCFVVKTGATLRFNPYVRNEKDQGVEILKYANYVNKTNKQIVKANILWQTGDGSGNFAIGDNTNGDRVKIENGIITVKIGNAEGNAVIAGYDANENILWSWHIWVNNSSPAHISRAVPYTTYQWDATGIHTELPRVKRQSVMSCNLGALADEPGDNPQRTYGLWYQWGRKDPFPSGKESYHYGNYEYSETYIISVYDAHAKKISMTLPATSDSNLFQHVTTSSAIGTIDYAIKHPTHFILSSSTNNNYDWFWGHEDRLWGGTPFSTANAVFQTPEGGYLSDNGATEKSIFDPCPAGWMMPPADMWAGFTATGMSLYDETFQKINCMETSKTETRAARGYHIYMNGAKWDTSSGLKAAFFPAAGIIDVNGIPVRNGVCGNYTTSTGSINGTCSIYHLHAYANLSDESEADISTPQVNLYGNSTAGEVRRGRGCSIRCVREHE